MKNFSIYAQVEGTWMEAYRCNTLNEALCHEERIWRKGFSMVSHWEIEGTRIERKRG